MPVLLGQIEDALAARLAGRSVACIRPSEQVMPVRVFIDRPDSEEVTEAEGPSLSLYYATQHSNDAHTNDSEIMAGEYYAYGVSADPTPKVLERRQGTFDDIVFSLRSMAWDAHADRQLVALVISLLPYKFALEVAGQYFYCTRGGMRRLDRDFGDTREYHKQWNVTVTADLYDEFDTRVSTPVREIVVESGIVRSLFLPRTAPAPLTEVLRLAQGGPSALDSTRVPVDTSGVKTAAEDAAISSDAEFRP